MGVSKNKSFDRSSLGCINTNARTHVTAGHSYESLWLQAPGSADHQTRKKRRQGKIQGKPNTKKYLVRGFLQFMRRKYGFVTVGCWV